MLMSLFHYKCKHIPILDARIANFVGDLANKMDSNTLEGWFLRVSVEVRRGNGEGIEGKAFVNHVQNEAVWFVSRPNDELVW